MAAKIYIIAYLKIPQTKVKSQRGFKKNSVQSILFTRKSQSKNQPSETL
jgi:hypothetical protein